jgi:hypothetical protein
MVTQHLFMTCLSQIPAFTPEIVSFIIENVETQQYMINDNIVKQGQKATHLYILAQGHCEVLIKDHTKKEEFVRDIR